jgi:hypothetical protein
MTMFISTTANNTHAGTTIADLVFDGVNASALLQDGSAVWGAENVNAALAGRTYGNPITYTNIENVIFNDKSSVFQATAASEPIPPDIGSGDDAMIGNDGNNFYLVAAVTICPIAKEMTK